MKDWVRLKLCAALHSRPEPIQIPDSLLRRLRKTKWRGHYVFTEDARDWLLAGKKVEPFRADYLEFVADLPLIPCLPEFCAAVLAASIREISRCGSYRPPDWMVWGWIVEARETGCLALVDELLTVLHKRWRELHAVGLCG